MTFAASADLVVDCRVFVPAVVGSQGANGARIPCGCCARPLNAECEAREPRATRFATPGGVRAESPTPPRASATHSGPRTNATTASRHVSRTFRRTPHRVRFLLFDGAAIRRCLGTAFGVGLRYPQSIQTARAPPAGVTDIRRRQRQIID